MATKGRILAVDDEADLSQILALNLEDEGYYVRRAQSGNEALRILRDEKFDVVISDIRMNDGDGMHLLRSLAAMRQDPSPQFFFMTGNADISEEEAFGLGVKAILSKPLDFDDLVARVDACVPKWHPTMAPRVPRFAVQSAVHVSCQCLPATDGANVSYGSLGNISRGGMFLNIAGSLPPANALVEFSIHMPVHIPGRPLTPLLGRGVCRWARPEERDGMKKGVGIEFVILDDEGHGQLCGFLAQLE